MTQLQEVSGCSENVETVLWVLSIEERNPVFVSTEKRMVLIAEPLAILDIALSRSSTLKHHCVMRIQREPLVVCQEEIQIPERGVNQENTIVAGMSKSH